MNNGAFGENFPYSNFHDMNMDWIVQIAKDFLDQYTHIQDTITEGETALEEKATALEGALQAWYDTHSADIANQLTQAIADFQAESQRIGANVIASIPADYTALSNKVNNIDTSLCAFWIANHSQFITYDYDTKVLTLPGSCFTIYKNVPGAVSEAVTLNLSSILISGACNLWMKADRSVFAYSFLSKPSDTDIAYLGSVYYQYVFINGTSNDHIKLIKNNIENSMFPNNNGSYIGMEAELRQVTLDLTNKTLTLPGGFKVYRGNTSTYSQETISLPSTLANKLWMTNTYTVYATEWNTNTPTNTDDDCIGIQYGDTVKIEGVPEYAIIVLNNNKIKNGTGLTFGDAMVGIHQLQEVTYDFASKVLTIPAGFYTYRGTAHSRSTTTLDLSNSLANEAGLIYIQRNGTIYAKPWISEQLEKSTDSLLGYVYGTVVILNGIDRNRISVIRDAIVYCFGDSIPAGNSTNTNFLQYMHEFDRSNIFKNYCVGSTGYVTTATGTVIAGDGSTNNGHSTSVTGNNNVYQKMNSVSDTMDVILISAGTNDWSSDVSIANFTTGVRNALNLATQRTQKVFVLLPIKREGWATTNNGIGLKLKEYSDVIKTECEARGIVYFDGYNIFLNPTIAGQKTAFVPDGLHPNENGHKRIARAIFSTVQQAICK